MTQYNRETGTDLSDADARAPARPEEQHMSARLEAILSALPDLVLELSREGRLTHFYSDRMAALIENPAQYIGMTPEEGLPKRVAKIIRNVMHDVDIHGISEGHTFSLRLADFRHWFSISAARTSRGTTDVPEGYVLIIRDITASQKQKKEIEKLSNIASRTSNMVIVTDAAGHIEWVNQAFEAGTGYTLSDIRGRKPGSFLQGPKTDPKTVEQIRAALAAETGIKAEILNYNRLGQQFWLEMDIQPTRDDSGDVNGYMAIQSDISERIQRIEELKIAEARARSDQATAMDASRDGIAITDDQGFFIYMNAAHQELFAIPTQAEILGQHWSALYDPDKAAQINDIVFPQLLKTGGWKGEIAGRRFDGTIIEQEVSLTFRSDGGIVCITRDIGARLKAEAERIRLREELQSAQRREIIGQMAAGLAHDFNNLIASISGSASLIKSQHEADQSPHAERILLASNKASELVRRLLDFGARAPARTQLDAKAALIEAADLIQSGTSSAIEVNLARNIIPEILIEADPTDFLQVVLNLAFNARDALINSATVSPEIMISANIMKLLDLPTSCVVGTLQLDTDYMCLEIQDNGPGMDAELTSKAFQTYFTTKNAQGGGLGLTIVSGIVESYDGAITLETAPGQGCKFQIFWPLRPEPVREQSNLLPKIVPTGRLDGNSILLVDDSEELLRVLSIFLERAGAEVCVSTNPNDVLEALKENAQGWDLLVTDFDMPEMSGADLASAAKKLNPTLPIVLITALPDWRGRASRNSGRDFLAVLGKPVSAEELVCTAEVAIKATAQR
jgi:PAS domain S-box-containing protein